MEKSEFGYIYKRTVQIKLDRIDPNILHKTQTIVTHKKETKTTLESNERRVTRSRRADIVDWVRILGGLYKGDVAKVDSFDEKNDQFNLIVIPRINYGHVMQKRPLNKPLDPELVR